MIRRASTIISWVSDVQRSQAFYKDVLGLKPRVESEEWNECSMGPGPSLALHPARGQRPGTTPALCLEAPDIKAARKKLQAAKVKGITGFHEIPGGVTVDFQDLDGHVLELVQYRVNR
jgi:catechol 2,3-dioxygenase-like lactoylglutathione lyase family enzyme